MNLAQDAVLGWRARLKSLVGTIEKVIGTWSWIRGKGILKSPNLLRWKCLGLPPGNCQSSPFDKLRAGSAGLILQSGERLHHDAGFHDPGDMLHHRDVV